MLSQPVRRALCADAAEGLEMQAGESVGMWRLVSERKARGQPHHRSNAAGTIATGASIPCQKVPWKARRAPAVARRGVRRMAIRVISSDERQSRRPQMSVAQRVTRHSRSAARRARRHVLGTASLHFSPRGEAKWVRGPSGRGARRLARAGVLEQYVEHGKQAQRDPGGRIACFGRRVVRNAG